MDKNIKILLTGGAGLVGQNLVISLKERGYSNITLIDKREYNLKILKRLHPDITTDVADLSVSGDWVDHFAGTKVLVMLQAAISGKKYSDFEKDTVLSSKLVIEAAKRYNVPYMVHVSSSVIKSAADDFYTQSKLKQEQLVIKSAIPNLILRPTLMFGWFDRKHLGWLSRFMKKVPIFPIPGDGKYIRQPLYVRDFCNIILSAIDNKITGKIYNISGVEKIEYIDMIRQIKSVTNSKTLIIKIPYFLFYILLSIWSVFDSTPPFTSSQLSALVNGDQFEIIDWENIFKVRHTSFKDAIDETFNDPRYKDIVLKF